MGELLFKEDLSFAYLRAVSAMAKVTFETRRRDENGEDVSLSQNIEIDGINLDVEFGVQLKSTSSPSVYSETEDEIIYTLKGKNYNDLIRKRGKTLFLMIMILPEKVEDWAEFTTEKAILRKCMYWINFESSEDFINSDSTKRIHIPKTNVVNPESLSNLMRIEGEKLI